MVEVVSRAEWGAKPWVTPPHRLDPGKVTHFLVHYYGGRPRHDRGVAMAREVEAIHQANGWAGIGYHHLVGQDGVPFEGRGWSLIGAQCHGFNSRSVGVYIAVGGDQVPTPAALSTVRALHADAGRHFGRTLIKSWHGAHHATECPGPHLISWVKAGMPAPAATSTPEADMPLSRDDIDLILKGGRSTGPKDIRAIYQVRDGGDLLGLTEAASRQLALLRQIAAGQIDYERLAAAIVAHGGSAVNPEAIAKAVAVEFRERLTE